MSGRCMRIVAARMKRIDPKRRPQYPSIERMAILELRAMQGWSSLSRSASSGESVDDKLACLLEGASLREPEHRMLVGGEGIGSRSARCRLLASFHPLRREERIFRYDRRPPNLCRTHRPDAGKALCQTTQVARPPKSGEAICQLTRVAPTRVGCVNVDRPTLAGAGDAESILFHLHADRADGRVDLEMACR